MTIAADQTGRANPKRPLNKAQRSARRHSKMVHLLRWLFPGIGLLILAAMIGLVVIFNVLSGFGVSNLMLTSKGLVMDHPELSGHDGERSYKVTARRAIQRLSDPRIIDLETINADIVLSADQSAQIVALKGLYNNVEETLRLFEGIQLDWSEGYHVELEEVDIDLKSGALSTSDPIFIRSDKGHVRSGKFSYDQDKGIVRFTDGIKMTLNPAAQGQ